MFWPLAEFLILSCYYNTVFVTTLKRYIEDRHANCCTTRHCIQAWKTRDRYLFLYDNLKNVRLFSIQLFVFIKINCSRCIKYYVLR